MIIWRYLRIKCTFSMYLLEKLFTIIPFEDYNLHIAAPSIIYYCRFENIERKITKPRISHLRFVWHLTFNIWVWIAQCSKIIVVNVISSKWLFSLIVKCMSNSYLQYSGNLNATINKSTNKILIFINVYCTKSISIIQTIYWTRKK